MPHRCLQDALLLALTLMISGCSLPLFTPESSVTAERYCLRSGDEHMFDCTAAPVSAQDPQDPLAPTSHFSDEELMDLLAETKRWLARRKEALQGKTTPVTRDDRARPSSSASPATDTPPLPRPWAQILDDFSPHSLQRTNSGRH